MDNSSHTLSTEFPPTTPLESAHPHAHKAPAPAGQTPPFHEKSVPSTTFVPSPVECASPTSGNLFHPATPIPNNAVFHNTPASPVPTFNVNDTEHHQNSPMMCGPTPASTPVVHSTQYAHSPQAANYEFATETFSSPLSTSSSTSTSSGAPHLATLKGNFTSFVGKVSNNPDKQQAGNAMIASRKEEKAAFFEQKAGEWELKGNTAKAQRNREKAARARQAAQTRLQQPIVTTANKTSAKMNKAASLDAQALEHERKGEDAKATKCRNKVFNFPSLSPLSQILIRDTGIAIETEAQPLTTHWRPHNTRSRCNTHHTLCLN